jgi:hypothetical protein
MLLLLLLLIAILHAPTVTVADAWSGNTTTSISELPGVMAMYLRGA